MIANLVGRTLYGEFGIVQNTLVTLAAIAQVATGITATKHVAEFRNADKARAGRLIGFCATISAGTGIFATLLLLAASPWLAEHVYRSPGLARSLMLASGFVLFTVMNAFQTGAIAGLEGFGLMARAGALLGCFHLAVCSLGAWAWGLDGAVAGLVASAAARWFLFRKVLSSAAERFGIAITREGIWSERAIFFRFALPAACGGLTAMPALWISNSMLVRQPDGFREMGLYSAAGSIRLIAMFVPSVMNAVGSSMLNSRRGAGDESAYRRVFWTNMMFTAGSLLVFSGTMLLFGGRILRLFGKEFVSGHDLLLILMLSTLPEAFSIAGAQLIQSRGQMWKSFFAISLPRDVLLVAVAMLLIPVSGAKGLAWAYTIAWTETLAVIAFLGWRSGIKI